MIAGSRVSVKRTVEEEGQRQNRPDHVIQMADERVPTVKMRMRKNGGGVVELKISSEGAGIGSQRDCDQQQERERWTKRESAHGGGYTASRLESYRGKLWQCRKLFRVACSP